MKKYQVKKYRYLVGPFSDPVSNQRHTQTTKASVVLETDDLDEAMARTKSVSSDEKAYVIRTSDGAEYAGGAWVENSNPSE